MLRIISLLFCVLVHYVLCQRMDHPVCTAGFQYVYINSRVGWVGLGSAWTTQSEKVHNITLEMRFATVKLQNTSYLGSLKITHFHRLRTISGESKWNVLYEINFPIQNPLPNVIKTILNGDTLCDDPGAAASTEKPEHVRLFVTYNDYSKQQHFTADFLKRYEPTTPPPIQSNSGVSQNLQEIDISDSVECGKVDLANIFVPLILEGTTIQRGTWPWLVSMYSYSKLKLGFKCGATLISRKLVLTAAHCFFDQYQRRVKIDDVIIILGQYNLKRPQNEGTLIVYPESINIHPNYRKRNTIDSDIAVVVLTESVRFTTFIRPACLWKGPDTKESIVGMKGFTAGWGRDESGNFYTEFPKQVEIPIVSDEDCLQSHKNFSAITTEVTFCAGWRNGMTGPCNGDSGGPLIFERDGRWRLRGIVSTSLATDGSNTCNLKEYVVFTDVAKFKDWIISFQGDSYTFD